MARSFLFGGNPTGSTASKYLVEFKAGKMTMKGTTVYPIKKKGLVYLNQSDDQLMHFCWKDRQTGQLEDDLIIFPDDAEFKRVADCTTGRVYVLKFKSSTRRCFYWMQEGKEEKDDELCQKVNEYLNNPPTPGSRAGTTSSASSSSPASSLASALGGGSLADLGLQDSDLQNFLNNMSPQQLMQLVSGVGGMQSAASLASILSGSRTGSGFSSSSGSATTTAPSSTAGPPATTTTTPSPAATPSTAPIQLSDLQSIISGITVPQQQDARDVNVDLSSSINWEALQPYLSNEEFMQRVGEHLPPSEKNDSQPSLPEQLASTIQSPQFQQALGIFSAAMQSGQLGPLMQQFGLGEACVDAANKGDLEAFVRALEIHEQGKDKGDAKEEKTDNKKDDDAMALD